MWPHLVYIRWSVMLQKVSNLFIVSCLLFLPIKLHSQKINFEENCIDINSCLIGKHILNVWGDLFVENLLVTENNLLFIFEVDSAGQVLNLIKVKGYIQKNKYVGLFEEIKNSHTKFSICYQPIPGKGLAEMHSLAYTEAKCNRYTINVSFPGSLMCLYQYENSKTPENTMSRIYYLKKVISMSIPGYQY